jgi:hypothetical protein
MMCAVLACQDLEGSWQIGQLQMCLRFGRLVADLSIANVYSRMTQTGCRIAMQKI